MGEREIGAMAPMAARYVRPDWVRRINAMGESVGGGIEGARRMVSLDPDELLELAERSLGGGRFGDFGDPHWKRRYRALVAAFEARPLHVVGRLMTRQEILRSLRTRLRLARAWDANPRIAEERIEAPIIVTGPARSGTTITFELFWLDPALRGPTAADAFHPVLAGGGDPRGASDGDAPGGGEPSDLAARLAMSECEQELWADVQPEFAAIHELRSDLPVECVTLTTPSFCGGHWTMVGAAAMEMDPAENYAFEKRFLQVLQHGAPPATWLLKTPGHVMTIDLVFATFPDAWVVQTHRDPVKTMPSTVSTTAMVQWLRCDEVDLPTTARMIDAAFSFGLNSLAERRTNGELPRRFVDVHFQGLMRDPVATIRAAYEGMGRSFTSEHADRIRSYLAEKPRGKFGVHKYTPEEWGFTRDELRANLASYVSTFGIELED